MEATKTTRIRAAWEVTITIAAAIRRICTRTAYALSVRSCLRGQADHTTDGTEAGSTAGNESRDSAGDPGDCHWLASGCERLVLLQRDNQYYKDGWQEIDSKWYYFDANGYMKTGWLILGDDWYYLASDGHMVTGDMEIDGTLYYFETNGVLVDDYYD